MKNARLLCTVRAFWVIPEMKSRNRFILIVIVAALALLFIILAFMMEYAYKTELNNGITFDNSAAPTFSADADKTQSHSSDAVNLNTVSQNELAHMTGIGRTLAYDIVQYRRLHGGFVSVSQLVEVDGIDEQLYEKIKDKFYIDAEYAQTEYYGEKINLNTASLRELKAVDGITVDIAESIINYRESCGDFVSVSELLQVDGIDEYLYNKIKSCFVV